VNLSLIQIWVTTNVGSKLEAFDIDLCVLWFPRFGEMLKILAVLINVFCILTLSGYFVFSLGNLTEEKSGSTRRRVARFVLHHNWHQTCHVSGLARRGAACDWALSFVIVFSVPIRWPSKWHHVTRRATRRLVEPTLRQFLLTSYVDK
jgi:hypothetical protein